MLSAVFSMRNAEFSGWRFLVAFVCREVVNGEWSSYVRTEDVTKGRGTQEIRLAGVGSNSIMPVGENAAAYISIESTSKL